ncbi:hypothetical protein CEXT_552181 [Caerostris extrusa]|uniref:Uncharacterized protein n=1 Tax=Caerostris extrusa TaxID=172846 RepID=A0AAV4X8W6_CAEEX|nr:hypothetical protein CEXT_552181 [Caerostris extrusa]
MFEYDCSLLPARLFRLICANRIPLHPTTLLCGRGKVLQERTRAKCSRNLYSVYCVGCQGLGSILRTRPVLFVVNYGVIK